MSKMDTRSPSILKETARGMESCFIESAFFQKRKIFLTTEINADTANELLKQLLYLELESENEEITLYINSPGGEVMSGLAVYDCMRMMKSPIRTVCTGLAASMGSILFLAGKKREMLPHTKIMIHDPSYHGGDVVGEKALDMKKRLEHILKTREILCEIIAERTGKKVEEIYEKTKEDSYFSVKEAVDFGIATEIAKSLD